MRKIKSLGLLLPVLFSSQLALAGGGNDDKKSSDAAMSGTVSDADTRKPVQGVTVLIASKGQDKKELSTDASGVFKLVPYISGEITIILEKKGYKSVKKEGVQLKEGSTLNLRMDMEAAEAEEGFFYPLIRMLESE